MIKDLPDCEAGLTPLHSWHTAEVRLETLGDEENVIVEECTECGGLAVARNPHVLAEVDYDE